MRAGLAGLAMMLAPGAAQALSCLEYSIQGAYWDHQARGETYILAEGAFSDLRKTDAAGVDLSAVFGGATAEVWAASFTGFTASTRAFDQPFAAEVVLILPDYSLIGGGYDSAAAVDGLAGQSGLVWLQDTGDEYRLVAELCAPLIDTDPASLDPALRCLAGGYCPQRD
jgi:hypothetical protein